jgi:hypothetical protein
VAGANGLFDAGQVERARSYHRPLYWAAVAGIVLNLTVLAVLSFSALGGRLYALTSGWSWWARGLAYSVVVFSLTAAVGLPVSF